MAMATASARLAAPILRKMTLSWEVGVDGKVRIGAQVGCALDVEWVLRRRSKRGDVVYRLDVNTSMNYICRGRARHGLGA